jgi:restriction system protein
MTFWLVRAGAHGEEEQEALDNNVVTIGWNEIPDLRNIDDRGYLKKLYFNFHPNKTPMHLAKVVGQIWDFAKQIKKGDLVALPLKTQSSIAIGRIEGDYEYREISPEVKHIRKVKWLKIIPRSEFDQDLLFSLGAFSTVCQIKRNDAEKRVSDLLEGKVKTIELNDLDFESESIIEVPPLGIGELDVEQHARDQIVKYISAKFSGHGLARLVESILSVQGYKTLKSEPGKDGGVDILAGLGQLGFNQPSICVQVKSSPSPVNVRILRELTGVMQNVSATQGLLVAWGGFTNDAIQEAKNLFFSVRLWDQGNIIDEIIENYENFNDELKAELPLKRIWTLVSEESN